MENHLIRESRGRMKGPSMADIQKRRDGCLWNLLWLVVGFLVAFAVTLFMATSRTNELSRRTMCLGNLSGIGKAVAVYWSMHDGRPPPDVGYLADHSPGIFVCPSTDTVAPGLPKDANLARDTVNRITDYVFVPLPESIEDSGTLMAFELPANHRQDIANALYADLHCGVVPAPELPAAVQRTNDLLAAQRRGGP